ncbi:GH13277 [Drosophila grimshawi]|uniref:GH13277 n=1 Tax=Drosophila grimshawi TaxID=7222 RepID=B4JQ40_DROGR|nr:GH13277 [Drosophila grimshawi]
MLLNLLIQFLGAVTVIQAGLYVPDSDRNTQILKKEVDVAPNGNFNYEYETSNGIAEQRSGMEGATVQGGSSYTSPEGIPISISYVADEFGYYPVGDHIPKVPDYILKSLEYIRNHPYQIKDYYTGELRTVDHNAKAFEVYSRPSTTSEVVHRS